MCCGNDDNSARASACKRHSKNTPLLLRVQGYNFMGHDSEPLCVYDNSNVVTFVGPCATTAFLGGKDTVSAAYLP